MNQPSLNREIRAIRTVIYTPTMSLQGVFRAFHPRFSDCINSLDQDFIRLDRVVVQPFNCERGEDLTAASILVRRDNMLMGLPQDEHTGIERAPSLQGQHVSRTPCQTILEVPPFTVHGLLHLPERVDLLQYVHDHSHLFMPVTNATVTCLSRPDLGFTAPFLVVNRNRIDVAIDVAEVGYQEEAALDPDMEDSQVLITDLGATEAAAVLSTSALFRGIDGAVLRATCDDLALRGRISRKMVRAGAEVFHQSDVGDSLYVVECGAFRVTVEVPTADPWIKEEHEVAGFGPGDFFGEMAILGEGRRTATVTATTDAKLVSVHKEAVDFLMHRFPELSRRLLAAMVERSAPPRRASLASSAPHTSGLLGRMRPN